MCSECRQHICPSGCPNAEYDLIGVCCECDRGIYEDDTYYRVGGDSYCEECIDAMRVCTA